MILLPAEVGESLGLGDRFQAVPFRYSWHRLNLNTTDGEAVLHVLRFADPGGAHGYVFDQGTLDGFASDAVRTRSGLIIPTNGKVDGNDFTK